MNLQVRRRRQLSRQNRHSIFDCFSLYDYFKDYIPVVEEHDEGSN